MSNTLKQAAVTGSDEIMPSYGEYMTKPESLNNLVLKLEKEDQVECPLVETWDKETRTYTREIFIPKGTMLIGFKHKVSCVNIIARGELMVREGIDGEPVHIKVSDYKTHTFITPPNTQKIGYAVEDTIFINVFSDVPVDCSYGELMDTLIYPIDGSSISPKQTILEPGKGGSLCQ